MSAIRTCLDDEPEDEKDEDAEEEEVEEVVAVAGLGQLQNLGNGLAQSTWRIWTVSNNLLFILKRRKNEAA